CVPPRLDIVPGVNSETVKGNGCSMKKIFSFASVCVFGLASALAFADDKPSMGCGPDCGSAACMAACKNMPCCNGGHGAVNVQPKRSETSSKVDAGTKPAVQARQRMEE